jgi:hypothetical protein
MGLAESGFAYLHADTPSPLPAFARKFPIIGMAKTFDQAVLTGTLIDF